MSPSTGSATPTGGREGARPQASARGHAGALRRVIELPGEALLRAGAARLQPRPQDGQAADRLRPAVRARRLPGGDRGVRGRHRHPRTLAAQIDKVKKRFALEHVVLVGTAG